jgi:hypothetical protein
MCVLETSGAYARLHDPEYPALSNGTHKLTSTSSKKPLPSIEEVHHQRWLHKTPILVEPKLYALCVAWSVQICTCADTRTYTLYLTCHRDRLSEVDAAWYITAN